MPLTTPLALLLLTCLPWAGPAPLKAAPSPQDVMESAFCASCHPAIFAEHSQSTHGRAYTDPEVRLATARFDLQDCIICHTPRPIFETGMGLNPTRRHFGLEEGNTCMTCHWRPDYDYGAFTGGKQCRDAFHPDAAEVEACASCHRNHGTPYQWDTARTGRVTGRACVDCHMARVQRPVAVGGPVRDVATHVFPGSRSESQLRKAYAYRVELEGSAVAVSLKNKGAGHNFPTELKQRSVESLVVVRDLQGREVGRSRMIFRDPYKRPYGLMLPVNTQIPGGESRSHRVPLPVSAGTVETTLFYKRYYPIDDNHSDLVEVLERRTLPFADILPSEDPIETEAEVQVVTPEGIAPEVSSVANLIDYARPQIGAVEVNVPAGDSGEDIAELIALFQFPVPQANAAARARLADIGTPAVPALIDALGSWDNKTYNQAIAVLEQIGTPARPEILAALQSDQLYVRLHARTLLRRLMWRGEDLEQALAAGLDGPSPLDRASAAETVGWLGMQRLATRLLPLVASSDPDVVRAAALALADLGTRDCNELLEDSLRRAPYVETRRDLAVALARLGSPAGVPVLLDGLDHPDDLIRESFFEAFFAVTGEHAGYDPLDERSLRLAAIASLQAWWAAEGGAQALVPDDPTRDRMAEIHARALVADLGGNDLAPSGSDRDRGLEEELVAMGSFAVPALIRGLKYPSGFAAKRALICKSLGRIGDPRAAPALAATLRDPVVAVAAWAAWALEGLADPATLPALGRYDQRLRRLIASASLPASVGPADRLLAQSASARLAAGERAARHALATLLLSEDEYARELAFSALKRRYGEDRGYDPRADAASRREAAGRWME